MGTRRAQYFLADASRNDRDATMKEEQAQSFESQYADALRHERDALHALRGHRPGSDESARAWQEWSEAITRTNHAWRELSSHGLARPPLTAQAKVPLFARGGDAPSR
jgi:hypothetical protein